LYPTWYDLYYLAGGLGANPPPKVEVLGVVVEHVSKPLVIMVDRLRVTRFPTFHTLSQKCLEVIAPLELHAYKAYAQHPP